MKKTAIVTGGSRGIGLAIAGQLCADGFAVVVLDVSGPESCQSSFSQIRQRGGEIHYVQGSITDAADRQRCLDAALALYGRADVLVNNAGVAPRVRADLLEMTEESFDFVLGVNTKGTMFMSQCAARQMAGQAEENGARGIIVNIGSMSAEVSSVSRGEYCVSKAGVAMLTKLYGDRLARDHVYVYEVRPGIIATDMTAKVQEKYDKFFAENGCPINRWGTPEDIALAVSLLCEGRLPYTTGQYIDVDGGFHISRL